MAGCVDIPDFVLKGNNFGAPSAFVMAATLIALTKEVLDKCELLCATAKPRYKDLFLSVLVNMTDFISIIDRPGTLEHLFIIKRVSPSGEA